MKDPESEKSPEPKPSGIGGGGDIVRYSAVGIEFAALVGLLVFGGYSLDQSIHPNGFPWFLFLGLVVGLGLGTWRLIFQVSRDQRTPWDLIEMLNPF